ncbi:hypothetical protein F5884DRAFT_391454 [Xylogone sp. PMI_703]|nr:hypothetical protein F5884DRAFT_391454 [Xylogone sp. PMI_703]
MPIYSNLYSNLARQGISKSVTHGYAQSVVAATHPQVYASQHRPGFAQRRPSKLSNYTGYLFQNAFHASASSSGQPALQDGRLDKTDGSLDAYFEAWRKQHAPGESEKEWTQFQFAKRLEWKPTSIDVDAEGKSSAEAKQPEENATSTTPQRSRRSSIVEDIKGVQLDAEEEAALAKIDAAIEKEIRARAEKEIFETELSVIAASRAPTPTDVASETPAQSVDSTEERPLQSLTAAELQSQSYAEHLIRLSEGRRYAEIPAVFEAMLVAGIRPIPLAYNALLEAAINLTPEKIQVVPKALDVYSDMLRRKVSPNTASYNTLINLLATRSHEVSSEKKSLEEKRIRYGGMEEPGKFMFASSELELAILAEDDRLELAVRLFDASVSSSHHKNRTYPPETYHNLISACAEAGRIPDMIRLYEHMESGRIVPLAATFPSMIQGFAATGDLVSAVECYNEYRQMAVAHDNGKLTLKDRQDARVYAAVIEAYIASDKVDGALKFYGKIGEEYGPNALKFNEAIIQEGFVQGMLDRGNVVEALNWADNLEGSTKAVVMSKVAIAAADKGDRHTALAAFDSIPVTFHDVTNPAMALMALCIREGDVASAQRYWHILSGPEVTVSSAFIEPTSMFAVAMIGSGQVMQGLAEAEQMFGRIKAVAPEADQHVTDEIEEGIEFIHRFMSSHGVVDPREASVPSAYPQSFTPAPYQQPVATPAFEDTFDPYAQSTDFKGSSLIVDELERSNGKGKGSRLNEALNRFRNIRRAGRHPRYITYAKLISAAAREERMDLVNDILGMARSDIPLLPEYSVVRYGWVSILDAMVGACLTIGNRNLAAQYHQELLSIGAAPSANTFGLYITTLKASTKTFDEATEAVKIFHRSKSEGVAPSSFLYNALIGKLGKARRIDDCLFYFGEMRNLGIRPTSVTYGTIVNALCRVSDEKFAEELFEEMEAMPNYKARPAPYNSLMQFFLTTKRDKTKVLAYYERMVAKGIQPTSHTYKLLIDTHATLEPINMPAAEAVLDVIRSTGQTPEAVHYASLIHAKGCVMQDMEGAQGIFDSVLSDPSIRPQACLYQALFEAMVANHLFSSSSSSFVNNIDSLLAQMQSHRVEMTPYIANTLIHGWASAGAAREGISRAENIWKSLGIEKREPSTYEAMVRAYLGVGDRAKAGEILNEMMSRGYPAAVTGKVVELVGGGETEATA